MKCPKCHRDTYSKKWGTCTAQDCAINSEERLTDAINEGDSAINSSSASPVGLAELVNGDSRHADGRVGGVQQLRGEGSDAQGLEASRRTPNRRSRESYNAYMKNYMARRRASGSR